MVTLLVVTDEFTPFLWLIDLEDFCAERGIGALSTSLFSTFWLYLARDQFRGLGLLRELFIEMLPVLLWKDLVRIVLAVCL